MERRGLHVATLLLLLCAAVVACALARRGDPASTQAARRAVVGAVGLGSLSLPSATVWGRELSDGLLAPLADAPAGYCLHTVCDGVAPPRAPRYTMRVQR